MGQANRLPALSEIEKLWFELQREIAESGKVVRFNNQITTAGGEQIDAEEILHSLYGSDVDRDDPIAAGVVFERFHILAAAARCDVGTAVSGIAFRRGGDQRQAERHPQGRRQDSLVLVLPLG